jgi:hypothetical protein
MIYHCNHPAEMKRDRRKWGKILEEDQHCKLNKFNIQQVLTIDKYKNAQQFATYGCWDNQYHFKFHTDFSCCVAPIKTIALRQIKLLLPRNERDTYKPFPYICASFCYWEPHSIIGRMEEYHDELNNTHPYVGGDDFSIWFCDEEFNIIKEPQFTGFIVLELHIEKKV